MSASPDISIPGYRILSTIHESAPRIVLLAESLEDSRQVVLKTLSAHLPRRPDVAELRREYQIARNLKDVPGVIQVHNLVSHGEGNVAIEMEPFGRSLAHLMQERGEAPLDLPPQLRDFTRELFGSCGCLAQPEGNRGGCALGIAGLRVHPFIPAELRDNLFGGTSSLVLNDYPYRGRRITVVLELPESAGVVARQGGTCGAPPA